jgi:hypothetical protein
VGEAFVTHVCDGMLVEIDVWIGNMGIRGRVKGDFCNSGEIL